MKILQINNLDQQLQLIQFDSKIKPKQQKIKSKSNKSNKIVQARKSKIYTGNTEDCKISPGST
jgi:hypothetical protein